METLTSRFVLASLARYFVVRTAATLANATSITLTGQPVTLSEPAPSRSSRGL